MVNNHNIQEVYNRELPIVNSDSYVEEMLSFFQEGWTERGKDEVEKSKEKFRKNVALSLNYTNDVIFELSKLDIQPVSIYIKAENVNSLIVLIVISQLNYICNNFNNIFEITHLIELKNRSEDYAIKFDFTFDSNHLDTEAIYSDGFINISRY